MEPYRSSYRVLLAGFDQENCGDILSGFETEGFMVRVTRRDEAPQAIQDEGSHLAVLNISKLRKSELDTLRRIRKESYLPVIILSDNGEETDKLLALELGADDYIVKPCSLREVIAKCKALLRRIYEWQKNDSEERLVLKNLEIDMQKFRVWVDREVIALTHRETKILWLFASNPGIVFTREHIIEKIWNFDTRANLRAVDNHIKRMRSKLIPYMNGWDICTVWGVGYRLELAQERG